MDMAVAMAAGIAVDTATVTIRVFIVSTMIQRTRARAAVKDTAKSIRRSIEMESGMQ